jgi:hypothetical protein
LLCFIALLGTQALGGVRGYISDCGGATEWTVLDPCSTSGEDAPPHEQVREDVQIRLLPMLMAPELVPVLMAVLGDELDDLVFSRAPALDAVGEVEAGPPPGVVVARTVVFLI